MRTVSIINLKGGVGKTISAINIAHILSAVHKKNVLIIDNDKQGNTSKFFRAYDRGKPSMYDVLTGRDVDLKSVVRRTEYERLDILPANLSLMYADREVLMDTARAQQTRLKKALQTADGEYDFVVIDNAPDLSISVSNAIVAADDILIPIKIDKFAFDCLEMLLRQIEDLRSFNPAIRIAGGFVTMYQKNKVNIDGVKMLRKRPPVPIMETAISKTVIVDQTTFNGKPLLLYAPKSTAAQDYISLAGEYLKMV